jgi:glucosyl-dolichyl phosphate glucuronosyltransferase
MTVPASSANLSAPLISVVICTRNRAQLLERALASVLNQEFPRENYEILVVDNGSSDRTQEVVKQFQDKAAIRYLYEERPGASIARNAGWSAAAGRYIAFLDDDIIAPPGWLTAVRDGFASGSPQIGAIGGPTTPMWEIPRPAWLADEILCSLAIIDWGPSDKLLNDISREWLVSANMAIPKVLFAELGGFHPGLGRVGSSLLSNEEISLQRKLIMRGYRCVYRPSMAVAHLVPASRLNQQWFVRRYYWQGVSDAVMYLIENSPTAADRLRLAAARSANVPRSRDGVAPVLIPTERASAFTAKCFSLVDVGFVAGLLGAAGR